MPKRIMCRHSGISCHHVPMHMTTICTQRYDSRRNTSLDWYPNSWPEVSIPKSSFAPALQGSTISWIPCGRKLTCSFPGIKFYYGAHPELFC